MTTAKEEFDRRTAAASEFPPPLPTPQAGVPAIARAVAARDPEAETLARQLVAEAKILTFAQRIVADTPLHPVQRERLCALVSEMVGAR